MMIIDVFAGIVILIMFWPLLLVYAVNDTTTYRDLTIAENWIALIASTLWCFFMFFLLYKIGMQDGRIKKLEESLDKLQKDKK
jgi:hypothetical protein